MFLQIYTPTPRMHHKFTKYGKCCMQMITYLHDHSNCAGVFRPIFNFKDSLVLVWIKNLTLWIISLKTVLLKDLPPARPQISIRTDQKSLKEVLSVENSSVAFAS